MNGDSTGLEPADAGGTGDLEQSLRLAHERLTLFNQTAKAACDAGEWKLQREAEDASSRVLSSIVKLQIEAQERERSRKALDGENPQAA